MRLVHREAEVSLLALQLLLAHAELALGAKQPAGTPALSPRKVVIEIRREMTSEPNRGSKSYSRRLGQCRADRRCQKSPKATREWPRRKPHKAPAPPIILTLTQEHKALIHEHFDAA